MNARAHVSIALLIILVASGCIPIDGNIRHESYYRIEDPDPGQVFNAGETIEAFVRFPGIPSGRYVVFLDGSMLADNVLAADYNTSDFDYRYTLSNTEAAPGFHRLEARFRVPSESGWRISSPVCFWVRDHAAYAHVPDELRTCNVRGEETTRGYPIEEATPTLIVFPTETLIPTFTPTATLTPYIPPATKSKDRQGACSGLGQFACSLRSDCYWNYASNQCTGH